MQSVLAAYQFQTGSLMPVTSQVAGATLALSTASFLFIKTQLTGMPGKAASGYA